MNKNKIAEDYVNSTKSQAEATECFNSALGTLCTDNYIFSLAEPIEAAYTSLVEELLGPDLFDWLMWWIYETDYGTQPKSFEINGQEYISVNLTLEQFWNIINA